MRDLIPIHEKLLEIEKEFPVLDLTYEDQLIWPYLRCEIAGKLFLLDEKSSSLNNCDTFNLINNEELHVIQEEFLSKLGNEVKISNPQPNSYALFLSMGYEYAPYKNFLFNRWFDPLKESLIQNKLPFLDWDAVNIVNQLPKYINNISIAPLIENALGVVPTFGAVNKLEDLLVYLNKKKLHVGLSVAYVTRGLDEIIALKKMFKVLLDIFLPKACFLVCFYNKVAYALCIACSELGIKTVDVQHGIIESTDPFYGKWSKIPAGGFNMLPRIFWAWGENTVRAMESWVDTTNSHKIVLGGNQWVAKNIGNDTTIYSDKLDKTVERKILFTCCKSPYQNILDLFPKVFIEAIQNSPLEFKWIIRTHYKMDANTCAEIRNLFREYEKCVEVQSPDSIGFLDILKTVDYHITIVSTTALEAEAMGVPNIIVGEVGKRHYLDDIQNGYYFFADNFLDLISIVKNETPYNRRPQKIMETSELLKLKALMEIFS